MLEFARPVFLLAGATLALAPLLLHLIARRPPQRAPLPTARFLRPEPRTMVHIERRPTDIPLLILRMLFLLLLGLGFAAPRWIPARAGTLDIVLLDRGSGMADGWTAALDSARSITSRNPAAVVIPFDSAAAALPVRLDDVTWQSLRANGVARMESDYAVALRALRTGLTRSSADSARATLITAARWGPWSDAFAHVRAAVWPGAIRVVHVPPGAAPAVPTRQSTRATLLGADSGFVAAALEAIGITAASQTQSPELLVALDTSITDAAGRSLLERVRAGATLLLAGTDVHGALAAVSPWETTETWPAVPPIFFDDGARLDDAAHMRGGEPRAGAALIAAGANARAAAAAVTEGDGCIIVFAGTLTARAVALAPGYTSALGRLARGCAGTDGDTDGTDALPLDSAARAVLAGADLPSVVAASDADPEESGRPLTRIVLVFAAGVALVETWLAYRRRAST